LALLKMVSLYDELGLTRAPHWQTMQALMQLSAEMYSIEMAHRFTNLKDLTLADTAPFTLDFAADRLASFYLSTVAQCSLAGLPPHSPHQQAVIQALRSFLTARQVGDDAGDWVEDLQAGQLNVVAARLLPRFMACYQTEVDLDRLAGYQVRDESFWLSIEQDALACYDRALHSLACYEESIFRARLIEPHLAHDKTAWQTMREQRATLRQIFNLKVENLSADYTDYADKN